MSVSPVKQRLRITYGKSGALKYTSNLDVAKIWERTLRRANLPILYTKGFNTRPRMQLASPLPLGITSDCELLDVSLREIIDTGGWIERIQAVSPNGLTIHSIKEVDPKSPALQTLIRSGEYHIRFEDGVARSELQQKIDDILAQDQIIVTRQRKRKTVQYDMRPLIINLSIDEYNNLQAHLAVGDQGNLRPDLLLEYLEYQSIYVSVHRSKLHFVESR